MVQTPLLNGFSFNAGLFDLTFGAFRPFLTSWLTVGISDFLTPLRSLSANKKPLLCTGAIESMLNSV